MARPRSQNRDKACKLWLESGKKRQLKDIANELQVSEEQIRKWKNQDKWDKVTLPKSKSNVTNHKGGQPGNRNAVGHGGTGPPGNKNAVKTGEFETLFFDALEPEEHQLIGMVQLDKEQLLLQEIQLLTVRERRMLKRIQEYKDSRMPELIPDVEDALTRVQARRQRAIESLHKFGYEDARLDLEMMRIEMEMMKDSNQEPDQEDDGFMDAMNKSAAKVWGDVDADN